MTVSELIEELKKWPQDMPIACCSEITYTPEAEGNRIYISERLWVHNNHPYDKPDFKYINLE